MNYMGVDIGTGGCKASVFDEHGRQRAAAMREYDVIFTDGGGAVLEPDEVIGKCFEVMRECADRAEPNSIRGIGISSQGEAFTAVGEKNEILSKAMVSSDVSSQPIIEDWVENFGSEKLYQITGHTAHPLFTLFKLLWFKKSANDIWKKSRHFFCFEDLLQFRLGLRPAISWSLAGRTMMFDVRKHEWDPDILNEIGLSQEVLAAPMPPGAVAGTISAEAAHRLNLPAGTFVVTGGHDQTCSALGAGVTEEGVAMLGSGTVECICPAFQKPIFSAALMENNLCTYDYSISGLYTTVAYSLTGGNILKWFRDEFGSKEMVDAKLTGQDVYDLLIAGLGDKPSSVMVLPYFTPSGTPYFDTRTKGAIFGLRLSTRRNEILKGLLEGVSFEMRLNLQILERAGHKIDELRWVGGGAKSKTLAQLKANVMNKNITMPDVKEAGCLGTAMLACAADTGEPIRNIAIRWAGEPAVIHPQPEHEAWYAKQFEVYRTLHSTVQGVPL